MITGSLITGSLRTFAREQERDPSNKTPAQRTLERILVTCTSLRRAGFRPATARHDGPPRQPASKPAIRVLVVTPRIRPDLGGTETHTYELARRVARFGDFHITVLATDRSGSRAPREDSEGFTLVRCRAYPTHRDYYISPGIYKHIASGTYDLVHCQGIHTAVPIIAMIAAIRRRIPYLVTLHTGGHSSKFRGGLRTFQWRALTPLLRNAVSIVAVSPFEQHLFQRLCSIPDTRIQVVPNGGDLSSGNKPVNIVPGLIISSGRLERYKGHHRAIEALPIVRQSIPDAKLLILGSGPYEAHLQALVKSLGLQDCVTIKHIAPEDRAQMATCLSGASAVAALSDYEAHPVAVMEALALSIPTVGLNTTGMADLVTARLIHGVPGNASPATIAEALINALQGRSVRGPAHLPTWDSAAVELANLYREAIRQRPSTLPSPRT